MRDEDCVRLLQWCLPKLGLRWPGYRRVRRTVCKRIERRRKELGLADPGAYRAHLEADPDEWRRLEALCRIPVSRFYRDREVFDQLVVRVLPALAAEAQARERAAVWCWSAGCASGEEPYSLAIGWHYGPQADHAAIRLDILASDADPVLIARARAACYRAGSLKDLPGAWRERAFTSNGSALRLCPKLRRAVRFCLQDVRREWPEGPFDLILCRNLAFTYFAEDLQRFVLERLAERLRPGGFLVVGARETLPAPDTEFRPLEAGQPIYRRG